MHDKPNIVKPVGKQIIQRSFDDRFSDAIIKTEIPIMNIETLRAKTSEVTDGTKPRPFTKSSDRKKSWMNK